MEGSTQYSGMSRFTDRIQWCWFGICVSAKINFYMMPCSAFAMLLSIITMPGLISPYIHKRDYCISQMHPDLKVVESSSRK